MSTTRDEQGCFSRQALDLIGPPGKAPPALKDAILERARRMASGMRTVVVPGALIGGKYRLISQLGVGAMGAVWAARNEATTRELALKVISRPEPEFRHRLLYEARALGSLRHRNIIDVHDAVQTGSGELFLVMEKLTGETLAELLARRRRLDARLAARIGRDVALALAAAHAVLVVHRDLKPANIFLHQDAEEEMVVKVFDFGVAKSADRDGFRTATGGVVGSPLYMSPEQVRARSDVDGRADIWALGVVMFEMLTGRRPFEGGVGQVFATILGGEIPTVDRYVRRVHVALAQVVARCMRRDREDRFQSAVEVAAALEQFVTAEADADAGEQKREHEEQQRVVQVAAMRSPRSPASPTRRWVRGAEAVGSGGPLRDMPAVATASATPAEHGRGRAHVVAAAGGALLFLIVGGGILAAMSILVDTTTAGKGWAVPASEAAQQLPRTSSASNPASHLPVSASAVESNATEVSTDTYGEVRVQPPPSAAPPPATVPTGVPSSPSSAPPIPAPTYNARVACAGKTGFLRLVCQRRAPERSER